MSIDISKISAKTTLQMAFKSPIEQTDEIGQGIAEILKGTHKTYRYILFTAILAKATNPKIDILSLQAKDTCKGAYDARSLCHTVVVPFERDFVPHSLGDSNEPYLNKPARFTRLSLSNAVRAGKDREILTKLIKILSLITTQADAKKYLSSAIYVLKQISKEYEERYYITMEEDASLASNGIQAILDFIDRLTEQACEGEICPLVVSALESICNPNFNIQVHNVNQCGASSKEVGDIDIYIEESDKQHLVISFEVKDKNFTDVDVEHAIRKFMKARLHKSLFIYGKHAQYDKKSVYQKAARYGRIGAYCGVIYIMDYARFRLCQASPTVTLKEFILSILSFAKTINAKRNTIEWIKSNAIELGNSKTKIAQDL